MFVIYNCSYDIYFVENESDVICSVFRGDKQEATKYTSRKNAEEVVKKFSLSNCDVVEIDK